MAPSMDKPVDRPKEESRAIQTPIMAALRRSRRASMTDRITFAVSIGRRNTFTRFFRPASIQESGSSLLKTTEAALLSDSGREAIGPVLISFIPHLRAELPIVDTINFYRLRLLLPAVWVFFPTPGVTVPVGPDGVADVAVVVFHVEERLQVPNLLFFDDVTGRPLWMWKAADSYRPSPTPIAGLYDWINGTHSLTHLREQRRQQIEQTQVSDLPYDYLSSVGRILDGLKYQAGWRMRAPAFLTRNLLIDQLAWKIIVDSGADGVMFLDFSYGLTQGLDRVRLRVRATAYAKRVEQPSHNEELGAERIFSRRFEYVSESRGDLFRLWRAGEKEALIASMEDKYQSSIERYPANKKSYSKQRKAALRVLRKRYRILPEMALNEGWPENSLQTALDEATECMADLLAGGLIEFSRYWPDTEGSVLFPGFDSAGQRIEMRGQPMGTRCGQSVYRGRYGNMYSLPAD